MTKLRNMTMLAAVGLLSVGLEAGPSGGTGSAAASKDIVDTAGVCDMDVGRRLFSFL
jgi:hypothetical protein